MKLSIIIPAYNEEEAIGATIERTLAARADICAASPVRAVEVIVVSDGSTDRTVEIAGAYDDIHLIVFPKNRGYGAAIKKGFAVATGDVVGFLDADGTCDPRFFGPLCAALAEENAAVAIGARLGPQSRMPRVRRLGNRIYALILSALSNKLVTDTASGMRVIRREALSRLYPLPDGLHFTPAMSARILMDEQLSIVECPMPYEERVGESKLHVLRDGVRFLRTILEMAFRWQPTRMLAGGSLLCFALMLALSLFPMEMWLRLGRLQEDMIYRLLCCTLLGAVGLALLSAGVLSAQLSRLIQPGERRTFVMELMDRAFSPRAFVIAIGVSAPFLAWLIGPGVWSRLIHGSIELHWSRVVLAGLWTYGLAQMGLTVLLANLIRFHLHRAANQGIIASATSSIIDMASPAVIVDNGFTAAARRTPSTVKSRAGEL